jgi:hypothetical protein
MTITQDDKKGMVMRARLSPIDGMFLPHLPLLGCMLTVAIVLKTKLTEVVFEIRSSGGDRRKGPCVGGLTKEKGNDKSFKYLYSEMVKDYDYRILTKKQSAIRRMQFRQLHQATTYFSF